MINKTMNCKCSGRKHNVAKFLRNFPNISLGAKAIIKIVPVRTAD
jgi:hypothetical protein